MAKPEEKPITPAQKDKLQAFAKQVQHANEKLAVIQSKIDEILDDGVVTEEEQPVLDELMAAHIAWTNNLERAADKLENIKP